MTSAVQFRINPVWKLVGIEMPIILASSSPRRATLLKAIGCPFDVDPPDIVEDEYGLWDDGDLLRQRAVEKAAVMRKKYPQRAILSADTIIRLDDRVFGKPEDESEAASILSTLSGTTHEVWSAMCFIPAGTAENHIATSSTKVTFRNLAQAEIQAYIDTGEPLDKAGAYGIQEVGGLWVERIEGCYFNIVGLPISLLWDLIKTE
jgi:septum formation protein